MSNPYFHFRKFTVRQERCAMKVCTDASLFGAWLAGRGLSIRRALDAGTGTGLLSLMLAQKSSAYIDAIEIDREASKQAAENFQASPWGERLNAVNISVQEYTASFPGKPLYDLIFSNPPFFSNDLKSPDSRKNLALHSAALSIGELVECAAQMLMPDGVFALIIPWQRSAFVEAEAVKNDFWLREKVNVRQTPQHTFFRTMYLFCRIPGPAASGSEMTLREDNQKYTPEFSELMQDYYMVPDNALR
jgi:tRNA1Val (adenine37-N6)-methyltransferase